MHIFLEFFSFADPNIRYVVLGTTLLTTSAAMVGSFALLKKKVLVGDAVAHAVLPGVCLSFLLTGTKNPIYLVGGAFASGWLSLLLIDRLSHCSKLKEDTAIALVLSVSFGIGILLLTAIQHSGNAAQVGLSNFLFGHAAALVSNDLRTLSILSLLLITVVLLFFKEFTLVAFDKAFAQAIGLPVERLELLLTSLTVLAIVVGIRAVGILLMAAILVTPAAAARFWTHHLPTMVFLAATLGIVAGVLGAFVSYIAPALPTGPWIVLVVSLMAYASFLFAPRRGLWARKLRLRRHQRRALHENILKLLYELGESTGNFYASHTPQALLQRRPMPPRRLMRGLRRLQKQQLLQQEGTTWRLTAAGCAQGQAVCHRHRLWETYLRQYLKIKPDHVHEDAESIEHVLTPALAQELRQNLEKMVNAASASSA